MILSLEVTKDAKMRRFFFRLEYECNELLSVTEYYGNRIRVMFFLRIIRIVMRIV